MRGGDSITTIPLRKATRDRLKSLGRKDETYDDVLNRLIDLATLPPPPPRTRPVQRPPPTKPVVDFEPVD